MKRIKYRYIDHGLKNEEDLEFIDVIITKFKIKVIFGKDDLFITHRMSFHENLLDYFKNTNLKEKSQNREYPVDGFENILMIDGHYIKEEFIEPFKVKLNKILEYDVIEAYNRKYRFIL